MPPTLILIRHAQGLHNVDKDYSLRDPILTEKGQQQCKTLAESLKKLPLAEDIGLVVVSPMIRTLQTMEGGLGWKVHLEAPEPVPVIVDAMWQENSDKPCDTGSSITDLQTKFPKADFPHLYPQIHQIDSVYPSLTGIYAFTKHATLLRGQRALRSLYDRPERVIAVVSHSGFLRTAISQTNYFNADYRIFDFDVEAIEKSKKEGKGENGEGEMVLREWEESREKGGMLGLSYKGTAPLKVDDFPPEEAVEESEERMEEVRERQGERVDGEAASEVPRK